MLQEQTHPPRNHWLGEPVDEIDMPLEGLADYLPSFHRSPLGAHPRKDLIVRSRDGRARPVPVAVVSKSYALLQHAEIVRALTATMAERGFDWTGMRAHLALTEYGTRMSLRVILPDTLALHAPDGHRMALTFECFNSVDGSVPLFALLGWFRFVCRNGLVVGTTCASLRRRHTPSLNMDDFSRVLADGLTAAVADRDAFRRWASTTVSGKRLAGWVDGTVAETWGPLAASRVHSIVITGWDGTLEGGRARMKPHERPLVRRVAVPGANAPGETAYAAAQALSWIAARRRKRDRARAVARADRHDCDVARRVSHAAVLNGRATLDTPRHTLPRRG